MGLCEASRVNRPVALRELPIFDCAAREIAPRSASTAGRMFFTMRSTPSAFGWMPSRLVEFRLGGDAVEEERIERHVEFLREFRVDRIEARRHNPCRRFGAASMPQRSTAMLRAFSRVRMSDSAAPVTAGSMPRSMSLAPSSRITASVPSGIDQSSRSRPPEVVSPDTPAFIMSTFIPLDSSAF